MASLAHRAHQSELKPRFNTLSSQFLPILGTHNGILRMTGTRFRIFIWIYVALTAGLIASMFFPNYSAALSAAYEEEPPTWLISNVWVMLPLAIGLLFAWLLGVVGLLFFKQWARSLSMWVTLLGLASHPFIGPSLYSGLESTFLEATALLWGAILALSYYSEISNRFERQPPSVATEPLPRTQSQQWPP
jgi:uncharacterized BrkB/YihY/UPF0761 family membrane protein